MVSSNSRCECSHCPCMMYSSIFLQEVVAVLLQLRSGHLQNFVRRLGNLDLFWVLCRVSYEHEHTRTAARFLCSVHKGFRRRILSVTGCTDRKLDLFVFGHCCSRQTRSSSLFPILASSSRLVSRHCHSHCHECSGHADQWTEKAVLVRKLVQSCADSCGCSRDAFAIELWTTSCRITSVRLLT